MLSGDTVSHIAIWYEATFSFSK